MKYVSLTATTFPFTASQFHHKNYLDCLLCHHLLEVNTLAFLILVLAVVFSLEHHLIDCHMGKHGISLAITMVQYHHSFKSKLKWQNIVITGYFSFSDYLMPTLHQCSRSVQTQKMVSSENSQLFDYTELLKRKPGTSLVVQWLRIRLPMQGTRV